MECHCSLTRPPASLTSHVGGVKQLQPAYLKHAIKSEAEASFMSPRPFLSGINFGQDHSWRQEFCSGRFGLLCAPVLFGMSIYFRCEAVP
jgi:hypothetical protein